MLIDIIAIIFIVVLSFVLCFKDNNYNCQLSHIILGLAVIVFYKLSKQYQLIQTIKNINEPFDPMTSSINDFISNTVVGNNILTPQQANTLNASQLTEYNKKLTQLINSINQLNSTQTSTQDNSAITPDTLKTLDLESQQQYQMFQIDYIKKQLQNAKDAINAQTITSTSNNYKPIKVYSSCVISNANGTTTTDVPVNASSNTMQSSINPLSQSTTGSSSGVSGIPGTSSFLNLSPQAGIFNNILSQVANRNANLNFNM